MYVQYMLKLSTTKVLYNNFRLVHEVVPWLQYLTLVNHLTTDLNENTFTFLVVKKFTISVVSVPKETFKIIFFISVSLKNITIFHLITALSFLVLVNM